MKKEITLEEYNNALERLQFIENEEAYLETVRKNNHYPDSPEFIIVLKREINKIDSQIKFLKKRFLQNFSENKKLYEMIDSKLEQLIFFLCNQGLSQSIDIMDTELLPVLNNYPDFDELFQDLKELAGKKIVTTCLFNHMNSLLEERDRMITIKTLYEKQHRPKKKVIKKKLNHSKPYKK